MIIIVGGTNPEETAVLTKLRLERFKGFKEAELSLGPFTLLVGANASGKSNIRDAFRFLHGIGRGYSLAEIFGEKWGDGGEQLWRGTRGGAEEAAFAGANAFVLEASYAIQVDVKPEILSYRIAVETGSDGAAPRVVAEQLGCLNRRSPLFAASDGGPSEHPESISVKWDLDGNSDLHGFAILFRNDAPFLYQAYEEREARGSFLYSCAVSILSAYRSMRFFDLSPEIMRRPAFPGQVVLGDRGENLASVLQAVCQDAERKQTLIRWLQELTPMDAKGLEFAPDPIGRIHLMLVEGDGRRSSAYSTSDGTLRFLAMLAALLGPEPARFYFLEEIENGIHPTRLPLLLDLFERIAIERNIQIVATTHSPQLLALVRPETLEHAALTYRLEGQPDAHIRRILDIPDAKTVLEQTDAGHLLATGWLENAVSFAESVGEAG